jgi:hypothetical protein
MIRKTLLASVVAASALAALPSAASARDGSSVSITIRTVVQPFCRIQSELGEAPASLVEGATELGTVREMCNTPGGYNVDVQLMNVASGQLVHGDQSQALDGDGRVRLFWGGPRVRSTPWRLTQASLKQQDAPVYLRVSISPL